MRKYINFNYNFNSDYGTRVERIVRSGFDGVFLYSENDPIKSIDVVLSSGLEIETLHLPYRKFDHGALIDSRYVNVLWRGGYEAEMYVDELCEQVEFAGRYKIRTVVMHITGGDSPPPISDGGIRCIEKVLNLCEKKGIVLCLENLRRLDYLNYIFESLKSNNLKLCFDSGHANAMTHNLDKFPWDTVYGDKLYCLHLNDNFGNHDSHLIPLMGNIAWESLINKLFSLNPNLNLTLEVRANQEQLMRSEGMFLKECMDGLNSIENFIPERLTTRGA